MLQTAQFEDVVVTVVVVIVTVEDGVPMRSVNAVDKIGCVRTSCTTLHVKSIRC